MPALHLVFFLFLFLVPLSGHGGVTAGDFPGGTVWYAHADLEQMRSADSGKELYDWVNGEVFIEIHEEIGIDIGKETDRITAFSDSKHGAVIIVEGAVSKETQDKILALAAADMELDLLKSGGRTYYRFGGEGDADNAVDFESFESGGYFSFDLKNKLLVTSTEGQMKALLEKGGKVAGMDSHQNALFVLTADKSLIQAGLRTDEIADDGDGWDSNILRNTEQAAILIADRDGLIAIEAQLVSTEPAMAQSLGGIINGLVALQSFNSEMDPEIAAVLQNTKIEVDDSTLSIKVVIDPAHVMAILGD